MEKTNIKKLPKLCKHPNRTFGAKGLCSNCWKIWRGKKPGWQELELLTQEFAKLKEQVLNHRAEIRRQRKNLYQRTKYKLLWQRYKLTDEELEEFYKKQDNRCKICNCEGKLVIDHDHKSKKVRGLLCYKCNNLLGYLETTPTNIMSKAYEYLGTDDRYNSKSLL